MTKAMRMLHLIRPRIAGAVPDGFRVVRLWTYLFMLAAASSIGACASSPSQGAQAYEAATFLQPQTDLQEVYPGPGLPPPPLSEFNEQTLRQTARIAVGGDAVEVTFSNLYGATPVTFDSIRIGKSLSGGAIEPSSNTRVTFSGAASVTIPPGGEVTSDAVALRVDPLSELAVSIFMRHADIRTAHRFAPTTSFVAAGDQTDAARMADATPLPSNYYMPKIVALRSTRADVLVAIGDSITASGIMHRDAHMSWPDQLAAMALAHNANFSVVNGGIGGNRWVRDNMGPCGLCRLEHDVFETEGATHVVFALGVNDLGLGYRFAAGFRDPAQTVSAEQIIGAMDSAITRAKARGLRVYVATIVPFRPTTEADYTSDYYTSGRAGEVPFGASAPLNGEEMRQQINAYIRNNRAIDGVIDIDRAVANPAAPLTQRRELTADGLHLNDQGSTLFAQLVYQAVFGEPPPSVARRTQ